MSEKLPHVIGSKRIRKKERVTFEIELPMDSSEQDIQQAEQELETYARLTGYSQNIVQRYTSGEKIVLSVTGATATFGLDFNLRYYDVEWVENSV